MSALCQWLLILGSRIAMAQSSVAGSAGAEAIRATDISRHIAVIADDSMMGRGTPSHGLEMTARYVADQFKALGLQPGGSDSSWWQRYPVPGTERMDYTASRMRMHTEFQRQGQPKREELGEKAVSLMLTLGLASTTYPAVDIGETQESGDDAAPAVLVAGHHTVQSLQQAKIDPTTSVFYVPPTDLDSVGEQQIIQELYASRRGRGVFIVSDDDSLAFAERLRAVRRRPFRMIDKDVRPVGETHGYALHVWSGALVEMLTIAGFDLQRLRTARAPVIHDLPLIQMMWEGVVDTTHVSFVTAPNTVGVLPGSDSILKREYIVVAAHMDGSGVRPDGRDSIGNGANDNASGVAGLIALARAFSQPGMRPRRSLIFVALSGGEGSKNFWGANHFLKQPWWGVRGNVTLHMIGRAPADSVMIDGLADVELNVRPEWLLATHPELGLSLGTSGTAVSPASDHFPFVGRAIPSLYVHGGDHGDDRESLDALDVIDADHTARIVRFTFYVVQEMANGDRAPRWSPSGRRRRTQLFGS